MPSPLRKKDASSSSSVAYTRWEAVDSDDHASLQIPFSEFEEDVSTPDGIINNNNVGNGKAVSIFKSAFAGSGDDAGGDSRRRRTSNQLSVSIQRSQQVPAANNPQWWSCTAKFLSVLIIFGVGWIFGFLVRWGIHTYYIDALGHCVTPSPYQYSPETAKWAMDEVNFTNIRSFFDSFQTASHRLPGSDEAAVMASEVASVWRDNFGLQKVEVEEVEVRMPRREAKVRGIDLVENGEVVRRIELDEKNSAEVAYSASAIGKGRLVYGHLGRIEDFSALSHLNFTSSVVMLRLSPRRQDAGAAVRAAQHFGASAVVFFPDPQAYNIDNSSSDGTMTPISGDYAMAKTVKFHPGDPSSPYFDGEGAPKIPVVSVSFNLAKDLLANYTMAKHVPESMGVGLPLALEANRDFGAAVEVEVEFVPTTLRNVIGSIPGRYEATRYVVIGSHHDTWTRGSSKPANAHSVLMELARVFGALFEHGWRPGRSIIFASWDGEEIGGLGSTAWLNRHSKELSSRAVAYIDLDYRSDADSQVAASPALAHLVQVAARSVACDGEDDCTLFDRWTESSRIKLDADGDGTWDSVPVPVSPFQTLLGVSTVEISLKNLEENSLNSPPPPPTSPLRVRHDSDLPGEALVSDIMGVLDQQYRYSASVARVALVLALRLASSPDAPLSAAAYADRLHADLHDFARDEGARLKEGGERACLNDITDAVAKFERAADRFHLTYDTSTPRLELLSHHEYSDQLMELERAMLVNSWGHSSSYSSSKCPHPLLDTTTSRHVLYGPSPLDPARTTAFPRLRAAVRMAASAEGYDGDLWECVRREAFFVADAVDAATCVLDNHLVYTYPQDQEKHSHF